MNQQQKITDQELKDTFINKAVEHFVGTVPSNQPVAAQAARDDLKAVMSEMFVFHHVGKK